MGTQKEAGRGETHTHTEPRTSPAVSAHCTQRAGSRQHAPARAPPLNFGLPSPLPGCLVPADGRLPPPPAAARPARLSLLCFCFPASAQPARVAQIHGGEGQVLPTLVAGGQGGTKSGILAHLLRDAVPFCCFRINTGKFRVPRVSIARACCCYFQLPAAG